MNREGMNHATVRRRNRGLILRLVAGGRCSSRVELARESGLTKMSITNIVGELMEAGYLVESGEAARMSMAGRSPMALQISADAPKLAGVTLRRTHCSAVLCDLRLNVLKSAELPWKDLNEVTMTQTICRLLDEVMEGAGKVAGIGVGVVGQVDGRTGTMVRTPDFFGIENYPIRRVLEERYGLPVTVDNRTCAAAAGELYYGVGHSYQDFIYLEILNGIGSASVSAGEIVHNDLGNGPELGHISIQYHGRPCSCGNYGCLERYAGGDAVSERVFLETGERLTMQQICKRSYQPFYDQVLCEEVDYLAAALVSLLNAFHPTVVVLGFDNCELPDRYYEMLEQEINKRKYMRDFYHCRILKPCLGDLGEVRGCAAMVAGRLFAGELMD